MKTFFKSKHTVIKKMLKIISENNLSLSNLINFYVQTSADGYKLYLSRPQDIDETCTINALHFYFKHIRGK